MQTHIEISKNVNGAFYNFNTDVEGDTELSLQLNIKQHVTSIDQLLTMLEGTAVTIQNEEKVVTNPGIDFFAKMKNGINKPKEASVTEVSKQLEEENKAFVEDRFGKKDDDILFEDLDNILKNVGVEGGDMKETHDAESKATGFDQQKFDDLF